MLLAQYFYDSTAYKRQTSLVSAFDMANVRLNGALREREEVQERTKMPEHVSTACETVGQRMGGGVQLSATTRLFVRVGHTASICIGKNHRQTGVPVTPNSGQLRLQTAGSSVVMNLVFFCCLLFQRCCCPWGKLPSCYVPHAMCFEALRGSIRSDGVNSRRR